jgi:hypothetical protein
MGERTFAFSARRSQIETSEVITRRAARGHARRIGFAKAIDWEDALRATALMRLR